MVTMPRIKKVCTCGRIFTVDQWAALGPQPQPEPGGARIELATCPSCGSTIAAGISPRWMAEAAKRRADLVIDRRAPKAHVVLGTILHLVAVALITAAVAMASC